MSIDFIILNMPEDRLVALQIRNPDCTPFDLTGATEIQARFKQADGSALVKTMVAESPLAGGISVTQANQGRFTVQVKSTDSFAIGERQDFSVVIYKGVIPSAVYGGVTFRANIPGTAGNSIALVFDGIKTVQQVINVWNTAHTDNQVHFVAPETGSSVLAAGTVTLSGGTDNRRVAILARALSVRKQTI